LQNDIRRVLAAFFSGKFQLPGRSFILIYVRGEGIAYYFFSGEICSSKTKKTFVEKNVTCSILFYIKCSMSNPVDFRAFYNLVSVKEMGQ